LKVVLPDPHDRAREKRGKSGMGEGSIAAEGGKTDETEKREILEGT